MLALLPFYGLIALFYLLLNAISAALFRLDKEAAREGGWRISEGTLLMTAFLGPAGAKYAQRRYRHKTRKQPFASILNLVVIAHVGLLGWLAYGLVATGA